MKALRTIILLVGIAAALGYGGRWAMARKRAQTAAAVPTKPSPASQVRAVAAVIAAPPAPAAPPPTRDPVPANALFSVPATGRILGVVAAPLERRVVVLSTDSSDTYSLRLSLLDLRTTPAKVTELVTGSNAEDFSTPVWSGDRNLFYSVDEEGCTASSRGKCGIYVVDPVSGNSSEILDHVTGGLAASPDGTLVAFWDYTLGDRLTVYDVEEKKVVRQWRGLTHTADDLVVQHMSFAPDGKSLLAGTYEDGKAALKEFNIDNRTVTILSTDAGAPVSLSDGTYFVESHVNADTGTITHAWERVAQTGSAPERITSDFPYNSFFSSGGQQRWVSAQSGQGAFLYDLKTSYAEPLGTKCSLAAVLGDGQTLYATDSFISFDAQICGQTSSVPVYTAAMQSKLSEMKNLYAATQGSGASADQANIWYSLNSSADQLASAMNDAAHHDPHQFSTLQKDAQSAGMDIQYCEIGQYWRAQPLGYQKYLALLPDGPVADQAWWKINAEGCGDFDSSQSTLQAKIALYQNFLQRFPNSPHAAEAQKQVDTNQQMLLGMQKPATTETQQAAQSAPK